MHVGRPEPGAEGSWFFFGPETERSLSFRDGLFDRSLQMLGVRSNAFSAPDSVRFGHNPHAGARGISWLYDTRLGRAVLREVYYTYRVDI